MGSLTPEHAFFSDWTENLSAFNTTKATLCMGSESSPKHVMFVKQCVRQCDEHAVASEHVHTCHDHKHTDSGRTREKQNRGRLPIRARGGRLLLLCLSIRFALKFYYRLFLQKIMCNICASYVV